jgi:DNA polymerase-3 subunit alpha
LHLPTVATHDIHYLTPDQAHLQEVQTAIRLIRPLKELNPTLTAPPRAYFCSPQELARHMPNFPQALEATEEIAQRCQLELPLGKPHFPDLPVPAGLTIQDVLRQKAMVGRLSCMVSFTPALQTCWSMSIAVIGEVGYSSCSWIVEEILNFARQEDPIFFCGSGASSWWHTAWGSARRTQSG